MPGLDQFSKDGSRLILLFAGARGDKIENGQVSAVIQLLGCVQLQLHGVLPYVLPLVVHLDLGYLPDTQGYSGFFSEPCTTTQTL